MKTKKKNERGQSLVELAISLVVLLFLLSGVVEFGIAFFQFIQLRDAAQEGALYGSINPPAAPGDAKETAIKNRVRSASDEPIDLSEAAGLVTITVTTTGSPPCAGESVTVNVAFDHKVFMPFVSSIIKAMNGAPVIPLNGTVTDTILQPACPL